jgi:predicted transcriptional regulator
MGIMANQRTTIHVPEDTLEKLDAWAERIQRSRNWLVVHAIEAYIEDNKTLDRELVELRKYAQKAGKK